MTLASRLVVIYAARSKILRRKIILDDESQLDLHQPGPGESRLLLLLIPQLAPNRIPTVTYMLPVRLMGAMNQAWKSRRSML